MHKSYAEILELSVSELAHWQVYYSIYPMDDVRDYYISANLLSLLYNVNRDSKSNALTPDDFLPVFMKEEEQPQTPEEINGRINMLKTIYTKKGKVK